MMNTVRIKKGQIAYRGSEPWNEARRLIAEERARKALQLRVGSLGLALVTLALLVVARLVS